MSSVTWNDALLSRFLPELERQGLRKAAWRLGGGLSQASQRTLRDDVFVANSHWTASQSAPFCPGPIEVISPGFCTPVSQVSWTHREDGVLVFGRVSPEKRIETCIEIVERLRAAGQKLTLCIAGPDGDAAYAAHIDRLCRERGGWIERKPLVVGAEKQALLGRFRYGLSACEVEAFGIATAEMAATGMIVFVPEAGAQPEIIGHPRQRFGTGVEAVERISSVMGDEALQREMHTRAVATAERFSQERFVEAVRALAQRWRAGDSARRLAG
jgi:glycosyltransferase involved in cell wall biosynthesis